MNSFTCVSWVCVLTLLSIGQSSDAEYLTEMEERRSMVETYVQQELDALEKKLKTEIDGNTALQSQVSNLNKAVKKLETNNEKLKDTLKVQEALQKEIAGLKEADKKHDDNDKKHDANEKTLKGGVKKTREALMKIMQDSIKDRKRIEKCALRHSAFTAALSRRGQTVTHGVGSRDHRAFLKDHTVVYDAVITNTDGAYNPTDGNFKCKTAGTYAFSVSSVVYSGMESCLSIMKNDERVTSTNLERRDKTGYQAATMSTVVTLETGDLVRVQPCVDKTVKLRDNIALFTGHPKTYVGQRQRMNTFSGYLLQSTAC